MGVPPGVAAGRDRDLLDDDIVRLVASRLDLVDGEASRERCCRGAGTWRRGSRHSDHHRADGDEESDEATEVLPAHAGLISPTVCGAGPIWGSPGMSVGVCD